MTRSLSGSTITASQADTLRVVYFTEVDFASGAIRKNSTDRDITWGGNTFEGALGIGTIGAIEEGAELKSRSLPFTLRGVPNDIVLVSLSEHYQGRDVTVWIGLLDEGYDLIDTPTLFWKGLADTMDTEMGSDSTVTLTAQDRFSRWDTNPEVRYTDEQQQARFPGDLGLQFISEMPQKELFLKAGL